MMQKKYGADTMFLFVVVFIDESLCFLEKRNSTRRIMLYTEVMNKVFFDRSGRGCEETELAAARSEL